MAFSQMVKAGSTILYSSISADLVRHKVPGICDGVDVDVSRIELFVTVSQEVLLARTKAILVSQSSLKIHGIVDRYSYRHLS